MRHPQRRDERPGVVFSDEDYIYLDEHATRIQQFKWYLWVFVETMLLLLLLIAFLRWRKIPLVILYIPGTGLADEQTSLVVLICCCLLLLLASLLPIRSIYDEKVAAFFQALAPFGIIGVGLGLCLSSFFIVSDLLPCSVILCALLALVAGVLAAPADKLAGEKRKSWSVAPAVIVALVCCWGAAGLGTYGNPFGGGAICTEIAPAVSRAEEASLDNPDVEATVRRILDEGAFSKLSLREKTAELAVLAQLHAEELGLLEDDLDATPRIKLVKRTGPYVQAGYHRSDNTIIIGIETLEGDSKKVAEIIGHEMLHALQCKYVEADTAGREELRCVCSYRIPDDETTKRWQEELGDYKAGGNGDASSYYYSQEVEKSAERYSFYSLYDMEERLGLDVSLPVPARVLMDLSEGQGENGKDSDD